MSTQTGRFACLEAGEPGAPLVLCLHGFPDHAPTFGALLPALARAGFRAVAPWMRGYAPSVTAGPYHLRQLVADVLALADELSPGRPVSLVGHDWGAAVTYAACALAPGRVARAVTLAVPHPRALLGNLWRRPAQLLRSSYMGFFQTRLADRVLGAGDFALLAWLWRRWSPGWRPPPGYLEELRRCLAASMPGPLEYYRTNLRPSAARLLLRPSRVPLLHLQGAGDGCIGADLGRGEERFLAAAEIVPGAGHFLHHERPAEVNGRIVAWLTS